METNGYRAVYKGGQGEIIEKKSRFIATVLPIETEEEALEFIAKMKKKYWDARHNCYAYAIGERQELQRCSDDGEPNGTAGRPMLDVLLHEDIHNTVVVVTRYFGGVLLGTGGLVRAYGGAVQEGLKNCVVLEKCLARKWKVGTDYSGLGKVQYILAEAELPILDSEYGEGVDLTILVPFDQAGAAEKKLIEGTNGRCQIEKLDEVYFGMDDGKIILL